MGELKQQRKFLVDIVAKKVVWNILEYKKMQIYYYNFEGFETSITCFLVSFFSFFFQWSKNLIFQLFIDQSS